LLRHFKAFDDALDGIDDVLPQPVDDVILQARIRSLLRARSANEELHMQRDASHGFVLPLSDRAGHPDSLKASVALIAQDKNLVRLLVGADFDKSLLPASLAEVDAALQPLSPGIGSAVLLRRPDVIEAEYRLRGANFDIGAARAQLFPTISLTGLLGFASDSLSSLFDGDGFVYSAGGGLSAPLFDGGRRAANVDLTEAQRNLALATYERTIQTAFREIADALADQGTLDARLRAAIAATEAASDTANLAEARYRGGIDSYLMSLDAERTLYAARRAEVAVRLALATNRITVYRVLGGDQATAAPP